MNVVGVVPPGQPVLFHRQYKVSAMTIHIRGGVDTLGSPMLAPHPARDRVTIATNGQF